MESSDRYEHLTLDMIRRPFGKTGAEVTLLGFGPTLKPYEWSFAAPQFRRALVTYLRARGSFVDVGSLSDSPECEVLIGEIFRDEMAEPFVASRVMPLRPRGKGGTPPFSAAYSRDLLWRATESTLERLRLSELGLQVFAEWSPRWNDDDSWMRIVDDLKSQRVVRCFALAARWEQAADCLPAFSMGLLDGIVVDYNLFNRAVEDSLASFAGLGIAVVARSPFAGDLLTPMHSAVELAGGGALSTPNNSVGAENRPARQDVQSALGEVSKLGAEFGLNAQELALRYSAHHPAVSVVIPERFSAEDLERYIAYLAAGPLNERVHDEVARRIPRLTG